MNAHVVRGLAITAVTLFATAAAAQTRPAVPLDPIDAILATFATHDIVALGDFHHDPQLHEVRMKLIADRRFPDIVRDIVFEFDGPQRALDRYVDGDDITSAELRAASTDSLFSAMFDHGPVYREFFAAVRDLNANLTPEKRVRIVLAAPEEPNMESEAASIRRETVEKGRKALLVIGAMHFPRKPLFWPISDRALADFMFNDPSSVSTTAHLEAAGVSVFSIYPASSDLVSRVQPDIAQWATPALAVVAGTRVGAEPFSTFAPTDVLLTVPDADGDSEHLERVPPDPSRSGLTEEQFDAVLVLAPSPELPFGDPGPIPTE
jgi:hypothetical protein